MVTEQFVRWIITNLIASVHPGSRATPLCNAVLLNAHGTKTVPPMRSVTSLSRSAMTFARESHVGLLMQFVRQTITRNPASVPLLYKEMATSIVD